jgi:hypothetical protein
VSFRGSATVAWKYRNLRRVLVWLRRLSARYSINFDNAVESSRKDIA